MPGALLATLLPPGMPRQATRPRLKPPRQTRDHDREEAVSGWWMIYIGVVFWCNGLAVGFALGRFSIRDACQTHGEETT